MNAPTLAKKSDILALRHLAEICFQPNATLVDKMPTQAGKPSTGGWIRDRPKAFSFSIRQKNALA